MPFVFVHGLPRHATRLRHRRTLRKFLYKDLPAAVAGVSELHLRPDQVTVIAPKEYLSPPREEIVVIITGIVKKSERTEDVLEFLGERVKELVVGALAWQSEYTELVEVLVLPPVEESCYFSTYFPDGARRRAQRDRT